MGVKFTAGSMMAVAALAFAVFTASASAQDSPVYAFYDATQAEIAAGPPGSLIRQESMRGAPWGGKAWRILYRSIGLNGEPIAVSGIVVAPTSAPPPGGHPVVAWAHPTTGVARKCAPSLYPDVVMEVMPGLADMIKQGFVVSATDYPGLGTVGPHPYLVGTSEARAVLDSVRAARALTAASPRFVTWGHSQGGHAALWTGEIAATYAPELQILGVAAAAPASYLGKLFEDDLGTEAGQGLTALTLWSWSEVFDMNLDQVILPQAKASVEMIGKDCLSGFSDLFDDVVALKRLDGAFLKADPVTTPPWSVTITENTPGQLKAGAPVFIAQGSADTVVDPPVTTEFATHLCRQGTAVRFFDIPGATHDDIADLSASATVEWISGRMAGQPAPTNCVKS